MIYTLTLSPSLDYMMDCSDINLGEINRSTFEEYYPGGKGINVSIVLNNLGMESIVLGFIGGFTGEYIKKSLTEMNIKNKFVTVQGNSRINVKIKGNVETAINGSGPRVPSHYYGDLLLILNSLKQGDYLILSGSIVKDFTNEIYEKIICFLKNRKVNIIVDAYGDALLNTLKQKPFLIKPNLEELEGLFNVKLETLDEIKEYSMKLIDLGAQNALVSLGGDGAIFVDSNKEIMYKESYKGFVKNTVGAGDSMLAGFVYEYIKSNDFKKAFEFSVACGGASAFSNTLPTKEEITKLHEGK